MTSRQLLRIKSINDYHSFRGLPKPEHPLISVINVESIVHTCDDPASLIFDFYVIALKRIFNGKMRYGQQEYDFDEGILFFIAPGQVFKIESEKNELLKQSGWIILVHPDFLWNSPLAKTIKQYDYFHYSVNEALFLSEKEELTLIKLIQNIRQEYQSNIDKFSQFIIIAMLELILVYSERFYQRQFITRKINHHKILDHFENILSDYFESDKIYQNGVPSVQNIAQSLRISASYLSSLLKILTGLNAQQHIHNKLIDIAKEKLSSTDLSIKEISHALGFEHPQSFSKLFKAKTNISPLEFRQSFD
jgi:AraC-like DNA-binding protein